MLSREYEQFISDYPIAIYLGLITLACLISDLTVRAANEKWATNFRMSSFSNVLCGLLTFCFIGICYHLDLPVWQCVSSIFAGVAIIIMSEKYSDEYSYEVPNAFIFSNINLTAIVFALVLLGLIGLRIYVAITRAYSG